MSEIPEDIMETAAAIVERIAKVHIWKPDCIADVARAIDAERERSQASAGDKAMTEDQIKHMVDRFLSWKLPENFSPDGGVKFERFGNAGTPHEYRHNPVGTNLLDANQAEVMVRHMLEGLWLEPATGNPEDEVISDAMVEAAVRAHAPQFDRMDETIQQYARLQMRNALEAALAASRPSHPEAEDGQ